MKKIIFATVAVVTLSSAYSTQYELDRCTTALKAARVSGLKLEYAKKAGMSTDVYTTIHKMDLVEEIANCSDIELPSDRKKLEQSLRGVVAGAKRLLKVL